MIDLYYWTTPNGHKITMFLEETGLPYKIIPDQHRQGRAVQGRVPDGFAEQPHSGDGRSRSARRRRADLGVRVRRHAGLSRREDRTSSCRRSRATRTDVMQWLFWQMGGLGPMSGQNNHFSNYAVEKLQYAMDRYRNEVNRLYGVMNRRLADRPFLAGEYSIADMASLSVGGAARAAAPEDRRLPASEEMARDDRGAARGGDAPTSMSRRSIRATAASAPPRSAPSCSARPRRRWTRPPPQRVSQARRTEARARLWRTRLLGTSRRRFRVDGQRNCWPMCSRKKFASRRCPCRPSLRRPPPRATPARRTTAACGAVERPGRDHRHDVLAQGLEVERDVGRLALEQRPSCPRASRWRSAPRSRPPSSAVASGPHACRARATSPVAWMKAASPRLTASFMA